MFCTIFEKLSTHWRRIGAKTGAKKEGDSRGKLLKTKHNFIMAKLFFYHDTRSGKGEFPIKIRIQHNKCKAYLGTDIKVSIDQWDDVNGVIVNHPQSRTLNILLGSKFQRAQEIILNLDLARKTKDFSASELKEIIENDGVIVDKNRKRFMEFYLDCMAAKKKESTRSSYMQALNNLQRFDPLLSDKYFEDINLEYLQKLDSWLEGRGVTTNSRAVYYRNIKSVFNDAIASELTSEYPFKRFKIKTTPTKKRNLSIEELRLLSSFHTTYGTHAKYRDMFMLMFYMRGINAVDLFGLKESNIRNGRINYIRAKTGKPYSVKIEPEMQEIIDRYKGKDYLIDVCDGTKNEKEWATRYKGFLKRMDKGLKKIGPVTWTKQQGPSPEFKPILPMISQYWCRHTCATMMAELDIPFATISASLGHDHGLKVTNIYIEYNEKKVDEANRKLIDYVNKSA